MRIKLLSDMQKTQYQICVVLSPERVQFPVCSFQLPDTDDNVVLMHQK